MPIVLEIEKIQNLDKEFDKGFKFKQFCLRKEQKYRELEAMLTDPSSNLDEETEQRLRDEQEAMWPDYRGFFLPKTLEKSILFTGP